MKKYLRKYFILVGGSSQIDCNDVILGLFLLPFLIIIPILKFSAYILNLPLKFFVNWLNNTSSKKDGFIQCAEYERQPCILQLFLSINKMMPTLQPLAIMPTLQHLVIVQTLQPLAISSMHRL